MTPSPATGGQAVLHTVLREQMPLFKRVAFFSLVTSLLVLVPTWFMLEVYDRVVNSRSERTLLMLVVMVLGCYVVMELLDWIRGRLLNQAGDAIDAQLRTRLFDAVFEANLRRLPGGNLQLFTDLRTLREFIASPAITAMADTPASLVFLALVFAIHPWLGVLTLVGALVQVLIAVSTEKRTMPALTEANRASMEAQAYAASGLRNAQVIEAMGMLGHIHQRWLGRQRRMLTRQAQASDIGGLNNAASKVLQQLLGSLVLGASCWLALTDSLAGGGGMMIVASVLGGRVLTPLATLVLHWRSVVQARDAYTRLDTLLRAMPERPAAMALPAPKGVLSVEAIAASAPGSGLPIIKGLSFAVQPGEVVAVIGPSACGKTTLARLVVGLWPTLAGKVRLDGVDVSSWNKAELGPHLGYLPQGVELFDGTLAENVARFGPVDREGVQRALQLVGMQEFVDALPDREDTRIGDDGAVLSGGQRQRVALARALYGDPQLVVLDEPNASLDEAGEQALMRTLQALKQRRATVMLITHRTSVLPACDKLLILQDGQLVAFGPRDEVLAGIRDAAQKAAQQAAVKRGPGSAGAPLLGQRAPGGAT